MAGGGRLPRTRGDGPYAASSSGGCSTAPPHTRGWTLDDNKVLTEADGSPAHAGMDPRMSSALILLERLPRTRGDGPVSFG